MKFNINSILFLFLMASVSINAQVKSVNPGEEFTSIKVSTGLFVDIVTNPPALQGQAPEENKIEVKGSERDKVNIQVEKGELQLSLSVGQLFSEAEILVTVYVDEIKELKVRSGSVVEFISIVDQNKISLIASEGSYIGGELQVDNLSVRSVTGASISLMGTAKTSSVEVKTGGSYDGEKLKTETTSVSLSFGGEASVYVTETCNATVNAGGKIMVYGNPKTLSQNIKLGGQIKIID